MKINDFIRNLINRFKKKSNNIPLLESPKNLYKDIIKTEEIETIISNMPQNLSQIEKAYYIYIELGKIVKENPQFVFSEVQGKYEHYNDKIDDNYYGICKSISELYVGILRDKRIGISADLFKQYPQSGIGHIDAILNIDGKHYITNLIGDLSRIKTSRRINQFGFDLDRDTGDENENAENREYLYRLEKYYGKMSSLNRQEIEQLDTKLGYSFFIPKIQQNQRGIYTEDTLKLLKNDFQNPEIFKKYVLDDKDIPEEEWLKYKIGYIFKNIAKYTDFRGKSGILEFTQYYMKVLSKTLSDEEIKRITTYIAAFGGDLSNPISIIDIKPMNQEDDKNKGDMLFICCKNNKIHVRKYIDNIREILGKTENDLFKIIRVMEIVDNKEKEER